MKYVFFAVCGAFVVLVVALAAMLDIVFPQPNPEIPTFNFSMHNNLVFDDAFRGTNQDSPLVYAYFSDFSCPICVQQYPDFVKLMQAHPEVNFLLKHTVDYRDDVSVYAALTFECLIPYNLQWEIADYIFTELLFSGSLKSDSIYAHVDSLGVPMDDFVQCTTSDEMLRVIEADVMHASFLGVRGTPTVFLNGIRIEGYHPFDVFSQLIQKEWRDMGASAKKSSLQGGEA